LGGEFAQNLFERYFWLADHWIDNKDYRDPKTGTRMNKKDLDKELEKIEKPASIANPKDFRNEVVRWVLKNKSGDRLPDRKSFPKLNEAVEKAAFPSFEEFLPVFARKAKGTTEQVQKYNAFVEAMVGRGYTPAMVELLGEWWQRKHAGG
jgi:serine protein kinase